jgi:hypothetical protein
MDAMAPILCLLVFHGLLGGADVVVNHELRDRLPQQSWARSEEALHSARELVFAMQFAGLGWLQWKGVFAWIPALLIAAEFAISFTDTLLEDHIRRVSALERGMHVVLFINFGAWSALLMRMLVDWHAQPAGLHLVHHGALTWLLSLLSLLALVWSLRDAAAFLRLESLRKA